MENNKMENKVIPKSKSVRVERCIAQMQVRIHETKIILAHIGPSSSVSQYKKAFFKSSQNLSDLRHIFAQLEMQQIFQSIRGLFSVSECLLLLTLGRLESQSSNLTLISQSYLKQQKQKTSFSQNQTIISRNSLGGIALFNENYVRNLEKKHKKLDGNKSSHVQDQFAYEKASNSFKASMIKIADQIGTYCINLQEMKNIRDFFQVIQSQTLQFISGCEKMDKTVQMDSKLLVVNPISQIISIFRYDCNQTKSVAIKRIAAICLYVQKKFAQYQAKIQQKNAEISYLCSLLNRKKTFCVGIQATDPKYELIEVVTLKNYIKQSEALKEIKQKCQNQEIIIQNLQRNIHKNATQIKILNEDLIKKNKNNYKLQADIERLKIIHEKLLKKQAQSLLNNTQKLTNGQLKLQNRQKVKKMLPQSVIGEGQHKQQHSVSKKVYNTKYQSIGSKFLKKDQHQSQEIMSNKKFEENHQPNLNQGQIKRKKVISALKTTKSRNQREQLIINEPKQILIQKINEKLRQVQKLSEPNPTEQLIKQQSIKNKQKVDLLNTQRDFKFKVKRVASAFNVGSQILQTTPSEQILQKSSDLKSLQFHKRQNSVDNNLFSFSTFKQNNYDTTIITPLKNFEYSFVSEQNRVRQISTSEIFKSKLITNKLIDQPRSKQYKNQNDSNILQIKSKVKNALKLKSAVKKGAKQVKWADLTKQQLQVSKEKALEEKSIKLAKSCKEPQIYLKRLKLMHKPYCGQNCPHLLKYYKNFQIYRNDRVQIQLGLTTFPL